MVAESCPAGRGGENREQAGRRVARTVSRLAPSARRGVAAGELAGNTNTDRLQRSAVSPGDFAGRLGTCHRWGLLLGTGERPPSDPTIIAGQRCRPLLVTLQSAPSDKSHSFWRVIHVAHPRPP